MIFLTQKSSLLVLLGAIIFIAFSIGTYFVFDEWRLYDDRQYLAGTVIQIDEDNLVLKKKDGSENNIRLETVLQVHRGRQRLEGGIALGDFIIVVGNFNERGEFIANLVRILESKGKQSDGETNALP